MSQPTQTFYRPEVDGLRAVAVLAVLFYHAGLGFPGGFVGVDVFFVISGYLITGLILKDLEKGDFCLVRFWERRVRRILPALVVVTLATLAVGWWLFLPNEFEALGRSAIAQSLFAANFYFWQSVDYFSGPADELPLLHTWSLAVEEQFYIFFPLVLIACFALGSKRRIRLLWWVVLILFVGSFLLSIVGVIKKPSATFYLLPTRAWELLAGAILAMLPAGLKPARRAFAEVGALLGISLILGTIFIYDSDIPFPGLAALPPCLGAVLFIWGSRWMASSSSTTGAYSISFDHSKLTLTASILASRPMVFVGLISYSLYLWHWPLLAFARYWTMGELALGQRWLLVAASIALGIVSWRLVETPFRKKTLLNSRKKVFACGLASLAVVVSIGVFIVSQGGVPARYSKEIQDLYYRSIERFAVENYSPEDVRAGKVMTIGTPPADAPIDLLIWGDSHAKHAIPAFEDFCTNHKLSARAITYRATVPLSTYYLPLSNGLNRRTPDWAEAVIDYVKQNKIPLVVLICRWDGKTIQKDLPQLEVAIRATIQKLEMVGANVVILMQVPSHPTSIPKLLVRSRITGADLGQKLTMPETHRSVHEMFYRLKDDPSHGATVLDPMPYFLNADGTGFIVEEAGRPLYVDEHHLTVEASKTRFLKFLEENFNVKSDKPKVPTP